MEGGVSVMEVSEVLVAVGGSVEGVSEVWVGSWRAADNHPEIGARVHRRVSADIITGRPTQRLQTIISLHWPPFELLGQ